MESWWSVSDFMGRRLPATKERMQVMRGRASVGDKVSARRKQGLKRMVRMHLEKLRAA